MQGWTKNTYPIYDRCTQFPSQYISTYPPRHADEYKQPDQAKAAKTSRKVISCPPALSLNTTLDPDPARTLYTQSTYYLGRATSAPNHYKQYYYEFISAHESSTREARVMICSDLLQQLDRTAPPCVLPSCFHHIFMAISKS
jgi:hypothetical protein